MGLPDNGIAITWACHWEIGDHLDTGDSMSISVTLFSGVRLKEFGVHIVYKKNDNSLRCNSTSSPPPARHLINGVDISAYQVQGSYFLCHHDFDVQQNCSIYGWNSTGWYDFLFGDNSEDVPDQKERINVYGLLSGVKNDKTWPLP